MNISKGVKDTKRRGKIKKKKDEGSYNPVKWSSRKWKPLACAVSVSPGFALPFYLLDWNCNSVSATRRSSTIFNRKKSISNILTLQIFEKNWCNPEDHIMSSLAMALPASISAYQKDRVPTVISPIPLDAHRLNWFVFKGTRNYVDIFSISNPFLSTYRCLCSPVISRLDQCRLSFCTRRKGDSKA